jgi:hypothetical protein
MNILKDLYVRVLFGPHLKVLVRWLTRDTAAVRYYAR